MKTDIAFWKNGQSSALWHRLAMLILAMVFTSTMNAVDVITDVMLIGAETEEECNKLKETYTAQGWTLINYDLNKGIPWGKGDGIFLLYKSSNNESLLDGFITDFYIKQGSWPIPDELTHNGRTYHIVPYEGGAHFKGQKGDLNSNTGEKSDAIHLYYTRDKFSDYRAVTEIVFNNEQKNAIGKNGGSEGYDLNAGAGGAYIYMHITIGTANIFIINSKNDWELFANTVNSGVDNFKNKIVSLNTNIDPVAGMVGSGEHPFSGIFYGRGHTINVDINNAAEGSALFSFINGATILDLNVTGNVIGGKHAAGLVGLCGSDKENTIDHCSVSTNVSSESYAGGIVGHGGHNQLTIKDSQFNGTISNFANYAGGLLGWCDAIKLTMKDCLFNGQFVPAEGGQYHPIAIKNGGSTVDATIELTFYKNTVAPSENLGKNYIPRVDGIPVGYLYDFENGMDDWTLVNGSNQSGIQSNDWHTGHKSFLFESCGQDQMLISPQLRGYGNMTLYFYMRGESNKNISYQVGTSATTNDPEAFRWTDTQTVLAKNWSTTFVEIAAGAKYIAIKSVGGSSSLGIDDICLFEDLYIPSELETKDVTSTSAELAWTGNTDQYNVQYREGPVFYENFDDSFNNNTLSWRIRNSGGNELTNWMYCYFNQVTDNKLHGYNGEIVALVGSSANGQAYAVDNWLVSPEVTLDGTLSFWMMDVGNNPGHYEVLVSTTTNTSISNFELLAEPDHGSAPYVWTKITIDLSKYKGVKGYIAFRMKDEGKDFIAIDDISIRTSDWKTTTTTESSILLSGLTPQTTYEFQVQGISGDKTTEWSDITTFTTLATVTDDVNGDGTVDTQDILNIYEFMQQADENTPVGKYDVNHDGIVDTQDVLELYKYMQEH